jgi:nucleotide-binding universal stress UspA family protein
VPYLPAGEDHKKLVMGDSREAERLLGPLVERVRDSGITYSVHIMEGLPVTHIPMFALEGKCDIVVMCIGSRSEPGEPLELVMGGVAERVFKYINVPLLIVH